MAIVGVICEYNPFHKGHQKQFDLIRQEFGEETAIVCLMSGSFVQRGEPAIFEKRVRAQAAVLAGANIGTARYRKSFLGRGLCPGGSIDPLGAV